MLFQQCLTCRIILLTAPWEAEVYEREIVAREEVELLNILKEKGIQVNEVANQGEFAARAKSLQEIYIKRLGQPAKDLFEKIDALR